MLEDFFNPSAVAVIGAAREEEKVGHIIFDNIRTQGYEGCLVPVNPKTTEIHGIRCYPTILDAPQSIDLALIVTSSKYVPEIMKQCADKVINNVIIISAGFKESSLEGAVLEKEVIKIAKENKIRILGPNCLGIINTQNSLNASFAKEMPSKGSISFVSQSGALGTSVLDWSVENKIGFSKFVSLGNKSDLDEVDFMRYLADDDSTKVIAFYLEGISNGLKFLKLAKEVTKVKPVVAIKAGTTEAGARAVSSHTGSLAGSKNAYVAAFKQAGIIEALSIERLFDYATAFSTQPLSKGNKMAVLTNAGGPAILASDNSVESKVRLTSFNRKTIESLEKKLPPASNVYNPVDILGDALEDRYRFAAEKIINDKNVDILTVILTPQAMTQTRETAELLVELKNKYLKPVLPVFMGGKEIKKADKVFKDSGMVNYHYPERAVSAAGALASYWKIKNQPKSTEPYFAIDKEETSRIIRETRKKGQVNIDFVDASKILKEYGINTAESMLADSALASKKAAKEIGYPVALKISSPDILHKTDVGGVVLGVNSEKEVVSAYDTIMANARKYMPGARVQGVVVQAMLKKGFEVIVGMSVDPQFGPLIVFGLGGIYVEILKDVSFRVSPLTRNDAKTMLTEVKSYPLLQGFRGEPPRDISAIEDVVLRVSKLSMDFNEIVEMDINPLMVYEKGKGVICGDVRMAIK
jgi:acetyl coenzyme A synthetase (ADP forming)-like protein